MSSGNSPSNGRNQGQTLDFPMRHSLEADSAPNNVKGKEKMIHAQGGESLELYSRARAQEKEIQYLKEQIALASIRESQMLTEKYALERKFSELRMAVDEKQSEVIASASNELARRKNDLEVNFNLLNELKAVEEEKHMFTSSMLGILAENGAWPHATSAIALTNSIKHLHDQLQLKIKTSQTRLAEVNSVIANNPRSNFADKEVPSVRPTSGQFPGSFLGGQGMSNYSNYNDGKQVESGDDASKYVQENDPKQVRSLLRTGEIRQFRNNDSVLNAYSGNDRNASSHIMDNMLERNGFPAETGFQFSQPPMADNNDNAFLTEDEGPGIEGFQIIGDAKPGFKLLGCGYPVRGTSLCMFQWVRHYPDGTRQYIEGATNPDYVVTADDVDKLIAVECIPMDEQGRQGEIVRRFANDNNKITCDEDMQEEIDAYTSKGMATFTVQILLDSSENWQPATLSLRRSGFQVKVDRKPDPIISEKYTKDLLIKIPSGLSAQFVLTCSNGSSYPFSTNDDIRMRDMIVLTMRIFQNKAFDEKRKVVRT